MIAQPPPIDPDGSLILSPTAQVAVMYTRNYLLAQIQASYAYGSANPRLGFGPAIGGGADIRGIPYPHKIWNSLAILASIVGDHADFLAAGGLQTTLDFIAGSAEARWAVNNWLGIVGGYDLHYAAFEGVGAQPALLRQIVFVGVSGYLSSDHSLATFETFASPVIPN